MSKSLKVIDLYSGVGGLSLSAARAGFDVIGAVEHDERIIKSHAHNFPNTAHICNDVSTLNRKSISALTGLNGHELAGLIGGPPCQGFSTMGKRVLDDERNDLFISFFKLARELNPAFFLAENVPGILNEKYNGIRKKAFDLVEKKYTMLKPMKLSANDFGAATTRTRVFFIGVRKDVKGVELLEDAINKMRTDNSVFVRQALMGLPHQISEDWLSLNLSWRKLSESRPNPYLEAINRLIDGVGDKDAIKRFEKGIISGCFGTRHSKEVEKRYASLEPGQQDQVSKSVRLNPNGFCPTLRAGTDSTKGSFQAVRPIHYLKPRVITPREAARLQGFPDWFQFHETKWHSFRQIGNSVCPVIGEKVLSAVRNTLSM